MTVLDGLPPELAQGLFAASRDYGVLLRVSTSPGDMINDDISTNRGLAIKVLGVSGDQLSGNAADTTQDFLLVDGPAFGVPDAKTFLGSIKLLAATTDKAEGLKRAFAASARGFNALVRAAGGKGDALIGLGAHKLTNPLGERFWAQLPIRYGDYIAKIMVAPVSANLIALTDAPVDLSGKPDGLREAVAAHFEREGGEWELRVQLCTNLDSMPIEDATAVWPEEDAPFVTVARIAVKPQASWSAAKVKAIDDGLAFSPWHGLVAHQPLGGVMRARKPVYDALQAERSARSGCPLSQHS